MDKVTERILRPLIRVAKNHHWDINEDTGDLIDDKTKSYDAETLILRRDYQKQIDVVLKRTKPRDFGPSIGELVVQNNIFEYPDNDDENEEECGVAKRLDPNQLHPAAVNRPMQVAITSGMTQDEDISMTQTVFVDNLDNEHFTMDDCRDAVNRAMLHWCPQYGSEHDEHPVTRACKQFGIPWDGQSWPIPVEHSINIPLMNQTYQQELTGMLQILYRSNQAGNYCEDDLREKIVRVLIAIHYSYAMLMSMTYVRETREKLFTPSISDPTAFFFSYMGCEEDSPLQKLIQYLLSRAFQQKYVRYKNNYLYRRMYNSDGVFVHCYEEVTTVRAWAWSQLQMTRNYEMWQHSTSSGNTMEHLFKHLENTVQPQLPILTKDRYVISFRNGLYDVKMDYFHPWGSEKLSSKIIACNYIPHDFTTYENLTEPVDWDGNETNTGPRWENSWWDIPTPNFDKMLHDQEFPYQVMMWFYVMFGRCLYWLRDLDSWQVMPFLYGQAETGKSTFCGIFEKMIYDKNDSDIMSNRVEKVFGLSPFVDKFIVLAPEVKSDFTCDQTDLQSMITGEAVSVKAKHQRATKVAWSIPLLFAGNEIPGWRDVHGAMARRLIIWEFIKKITVDVSLESKLRTEIPAIIIKCNRFYQAAVDKVGAESIWKHLPEYFHTMRRRIHGSTSSIHGFFESDVLRIVRKEDGSVNRDVFMPLDTLRDAYHDWRVVNGIQAAEKWEATVYNRVLSDFRLPAPDRVRRAYPRDSTQAPKQRLYVYGVDLSTEVDRLGY